MNREQDDHGSIWARRNNLAASGATQQLETALGPLGTRRARAGTLPSRLPSRQKPPLSLSTDSTDPHPHLGSLALISPDGNDILYDSFPASGSAVGQPTTPRRTPPLPPMPQHARRTSPHAALLSTLPPPGVSGPPATAGAAAGPAGPAGPPGLTPSSTGASVSAPTGPSPAPLRTLQPPTVGRNRSESMHSLGRSPVFSPFSIWNTPGGMGSTVGSAGSAASTSPPPPAATTSSSSEASPDTTMVNDPMLIFSNELNKTANPHRIRSYTLDGQADWAAPQIPQFVGRSVARPRAQTLFGGAPVPPPQVALGRFGKSHQLLHEQALDGYVVQLGDFSPTPTPALWVSNVPVQATPYSLHTLFGCFGRLETARVIPAQRSAYIAFTSTAHAIEAQATTNGAELYTGNGPSQVAFAKVVPAAGTAPAATSAAAAPAPAPASAHSRASPPAPSISVAYILQALNADVTEISADIALLQRAGSTDFNVPIRPLSELLAADPELTERTYTAAVLRDLRRRPESLSQKEVHDLALDMLRELPSLASDYIGNTVVQFVFERSASHIRDMMLRRLVDVFAATGMHKNGTWAVQKMIDLAAGARQFSIIERAIKPHLVALLLDQFGNYVVQGCLKFGAPYSDFVYSGIATSLAQIAPSRFGARAIRGVLESEHSGLRQQRLVATMIVQRITTLAANPNGNLLVVWLLDNFGRSEDATAARAMHAKTHSLVAAQLVPQYLVQMCTSKLGANIVLKLAAGSSAQQVFDALLEPLSDRLPPLLQQLLDDESGQGATFIYRLLTTTLPSTSVERQVAVNKVRMCLLQPGARIPQHKRLLEEVGLAVLLPDQEPALGESNQPISSSVE